MNFREILLFKKSENNKINLLRYILFLPASLILYLITFLVILFLTHMNDWLLGDSWIEQYIPFFSYDANTATSALMGACTFWIVYGPYHIIPIHKKITSFIMLSLFILYLAVAIYGDYLGGRQPDYLNIISQIVGVLYAFYLSINNRSIQLY